MSAQYSAELKKTVMQRLETGESIKKLSEELHISKSTLYRWRKIYSPAKVKQYSYTPKEFDALSRRLLKLEHKMEIIHLSGYLAAVPLQKKLDTLEHIYQQNQQYSVHELCEALDVARGTFYNHIFRRADRSAYEAEQAQLMLRVQQIFDDNAQRYGAEKSGSFLLIAASA
jgi:hypothetical protein